MNKLEFLKVSKTYTGGYGAIAHASFSLEYGDRLTVIGERSSGKTTLAKLAAGLEDLSAGTIKFNGETELTPDACNIGYYTDGMRGRARVYTTVEYPLRLRGVSDTQGPVTAALELFGIAGLARLRVKDLPPVQRRSVALARLFAVERDLYVIDDPFGDLPLSERGVLLEELKRAIETVKGTVIYFTDSVDEAERLGFMKNALLTYGVLGEIGTLKELKQSPQSLAEAVMISGGNINVIPVKENGSVIVPSLERILVGIETIGEFSCVTAALYYDDLVIGAGDFTGRVTGVYSNTAGYNIVVECGDRKAAIFSDKPYSAGETVKFGIKEGAVKLFDGRSEQSILRD